MGCLVHPQVKRITPRHLQLAIRGDEELDTLIKVFLYDHLTQLTLRLFLRGHHIKLHGTRGPPTTKNKNCTISPYQQQYMAVVQATIAGGGVIPHIHKSLINKVGKKEG